jgi:hypothetical protein
MATTLLKDCIGPVYGYDPLVPGSDALYNERVRVLDMSDPGNPGGGWDYTERFVQCLATPRNFNRPTDPAVNQVLNLTFADESDVYGYGGGNAFNNTIITAQYAADIATLRTNRIANPGIQGVAYRVATTDSPGPYPGFRGLTEATFVNTGVYTPNANISDLTGFAYELDVTPGATPAYYLTQITNGLTTLGFVVSC